MHIPLDRDIPAAIVPVTEREYALARQQVPYYPEQQDPASVGIPFTYYFWVLRRNLLLIAGFVLACTIVTAIISYRLTPIYDATATIDVDRRAPTGVIGQEAAASAVSDTEQFLGTQVKTIQTASVLKPIRHAFEATGPSDRAGFRLRDLKVTRPPGTFLIYINYQSPDPERAANIANAIAKSYIEHTYNIRYLASVGLSSFMEKQIEELRSKMERSTDKLASFERELNMIRPEEKNGIVSARLLQLNTEFTTAQAERSKREAAYESVKNGTLEAAQVSTQGDSIRRLTDRLDEAQEKFGSVKQQYGDSHPEYKKAASRVHQLQGELEQFRENIIRRVESEYKEAVNREGILKREVEETKREFDSLNVRSFQYQSLKREADADRKLYEELANRIKEAGINAGFQNSAIRLSDPAQRSDSPVFPNIRNNILLAFFCSLGLATVAAIAVDKADATLRSPEDAERVLGTEVIGLLPLVKHWTGGWFQAIPAGTNGNRGASGSETRSYEDSVRSLRNCILLSAFGKPLRSLLVTSACPAEGKTTTAASLAAAHAQQKRKTLLIDCDLRRPGIRRLFKMETGNGLSQVMSLGLPWRDQIVDMDGIPGLFILPAGAASPGEADMIGRLLPHILLEATQEYDLIILDCPPALGFPEPLQLAAAVDGVVLVALAGRTNRKAVASVINTLQRLRVNLVGLVLNEITHKTTDGYYHYYGYYGKYKRYYSDVTESTE